MGYSAGQARKTHVCFSVVRSDIQTGRRSFASPFSNFILFSPFEDCITLIRFHPLLYTSLWIVSNVSSVHTGCLTSDMCPFMEILL